MNNAINELLAQIKECFGGVTTGSFAPAVTNTVYPRPDKKKSKFRQKTEDLLKEFGLDDDDDDDYDDNKYYTTRSEWANANWDEMRKNELELQKAKEKTRSDFLDKYKKRNNAYIEKLNSYYDLWSKQPDVDVVKLMTWYRDSLRKINRAQYDCYQYEKMPITQFKQKEAKMKAIPIKFEYWRVRAILPGEE